MIARRKHFRDTPGREKTFFKLKDNTGTGTNGYKSSRIYLGRTLEDDLVQKREVLEQSPRGSSWGRNNRTVCRWDLFSLLKGLYDIFAHRSRRLPSMTQKLWETCLPCSLATVFEVRT